MAEAACYIAEGKTWVVFCEGRTVRGQAVSEEGIGVVGPALWEDHGGIAGGGHGKPRVLPAPRDLRAVVEGGCTPGPVPGTGRC